MSVFLFILSNNIIPIFILILLGFAMGKNFNMDIATLTKLNFYVFVPSFTFVNLYTTQIPIEMTKVLIVTICILVTNILVSWIISKGFAYDEGLKNAFANSIIFFNTGNIGVPLITLLFSSAPFLIDGETPYLNIALTAQIMILVVQNITTNTIGFMNAGRATTPWKESFYKVLKMPTIYAVPLAFLLKGVPYDITMLPIWPTLNYARHALVPVALIALGIQLSKTAFVFKNRAVYVSALVRLFGGPVFAMFFLYLFQIEGIMAQVVMISAALPTAVNTALIAVEYDNYPDFASQAVMLSTLLSGGSLVFIIYMARIIFPIV
ncbi:MAG: AEC family transporter [Thermotaleaceae bacterium]